MDFLEVVQQLAFQGEHAIPIVVNLDPLGRDDSQHKLWVLRNWCLLVSHIF